MIQPQELRLGNYVLYNGMICVVSSIIEPTPTKDRFNNKYVISLWNNGSFNATIDEIEPIVITEEILFKCGFLKDENEIYHIDIFTHYLELMNSMECYYPIYIQKAQMSSENEQRIGLNNLEFVNQLQNLFYSLTGEELTFKN